MFCISFVQGTDWVHYTVYCLQIPPAFAPFHCPPIDLIIFHHFSAIYFGHNLQLYGCAGANARLQCFIEDPLVYLLVHPLVLQRFI